MVRCLLAFVVALGVSSGCGNGGGDDPGKSRTPPADATPGATGNAPAPTPMPASPQLGIDRADDTHFVVDEDALIHLAIEAAAGNLPIAAAGTGYEVTAAPEGSVLAQLGLARGDVLESVNGGPLGNAQVVRDIYEKARSESGVLVVSLTRAGAKRTHHYALLGRLSDDLVDEAARQGTWDAPEPLAKLLDALSPGVKEVGDRQYDVDRIVVEMFGDEHGLAAAGRASSTRDPDGVIAVRRPSIWGLLGLDRYDTIKAINDIDADSGRGAERQLAEQSTRPGFTISIVRAHDPMVLRYTVVEGRVSNAAIAQAIHDWRQHLNLNAGP